MKITVFGASGRTGVHVVVLALAAGHDIVAFVRDPAKLPIQNPRLAVVQGDVRDAERVTLAVRGADAVMSVLGPAGNTREHAVSQGTAHIVSAMQRQGIRRLVVSTGAGVRDPNDTPGLPDRLISLLLKLTARHVLEDMQQAMQIVRASGLDWTIVRAPMLTDGPATGHVRAGYVGKGIGPRLSRADMADFMLKQLTDETYLCKAPAISN